MSPPTFPSGLARLRAALGRLRQAAHLAVGLPDYQDYVAHRRARHPGEPVMTYEEFFRERQASRYRRGSSRCC
ncbi:MAG TPA: YbdD/YjiX family protein [Nevskia sp.]|jgi:uncharacterized short protein YbdD (DUF466 family)|nr:YbdD/YjiX family protein [Nevskia sp.]